MHDHGDHTAMQSTSTLFRAGELLLFWLYIGHIDISPRLSPFLIRVLTASFLSASRLSTVSMELTVTIYIQNGALRHRQYVKD